MDIEAPWTAHQGQQMQQQQHHHPHHQQQLQSSLSIVQVVTVYLAILSSTAANAWTDPLYSSDFIAQLLLLCLRFFLLSAILLAFFVLSTSSSRDLQIGRYDRYIRRHAVPYAAALTYAALLGAVGVYNLVLVRRGAWDAVSLWAAPGYVPLWTISRAALLLFLATASYAAAAELTGKVARGQQQGLGG